MSIAGLFDNKNKTSSKVNGVVIGVVTNNNDEEGLGRVKVKFPCISNDDESHWARITTPMAGKEMGICFLPEVDDEVLVVFENGDINTPYIIGSLWNGTDKPPVTNDGENNIRVIKSRSGHTITLNDKKGEETIEIVDKTANNSIVISTKDKKISIKSDQDIELIAPNGKISLNAKDIEMKSSAGTKLDASAGLDLMASGTTTVKGATVNIN